MRNLLLALLMIPAADLDTIAQAADNVPGTIAVESQRRSPTTPNSSTRAPVQHDAPDCNGQSPSTTSVTALLSRLVRPSTIAKGVYCPIPPVSDQAPAQERHP